MRRYYLRDLIAPRFFETCLNDYVRACSERDWKTAAVALDGLNHFARLRPSSLRLRWKMRWVQSPTVPPLGATERRATQRLAFRPPPRRHAALRNRSCSASRRCSGPHTPTCRRRLRISTR